jgi:hypothetical protein
LLVTRPQSPGTRAGHQSFVDTHGASEVRPPCLDLLHLLSLRAAFPALCTVSAGMEDATGPSSQRFECGDDNVFGHQFRRLKIREEQACSHCIQYADKLLS